MFVLKLLGKLERCLEVFSHIKEGFLIKLLLFIWGIGDEFEDEVFAFLEYFEVRTVEVNVPELIAANQWRLENLIVILLETN